MEINFEESLNELESIVEKLENGKISLDESLVLFEKGVRIVRECSNKLQNAQQKVETLIAENQNQQPAASIHEGSSEQSIDSR